ncbi:MAG: NADH-quinone oxidoreductase subunit N [Anaerolineales bacterium]
MTQPFGPGVLAAILPEVLLLILAGIVLAADLLGRPSRRRMVGWVASIGVGATLVATLIYARPPAESPVILGGMIRHDWSGFAFQVLFLFSAAVACLLSIDLHGLGERGEYYSLIIVSTLGMCLMASASDLVMLYLAIETTSIPLYVLAGFFKRDDRSTESGLKYFLFGALTSTVMLYGFSLLFGATGQTDLYQIAAAMSGKAIPSAVIAASAILVLVGFGFKVAVVPFHFWTPDVYEGAPTPITALISTASKAAGFAVLVRVMLAAFPEVVPFWTSLLAILAAATMTLGNLLALVQKNMKRLLAYSSIAHAGYALIGVVALSELGSASVVFYLLAYVVTNLATFAVVVLFAQSAGSETIADYAGLSRRSPGLALVLLIGMLSLAGMPPLAGFVAKVYVFAAAVQSGWIWLAFVGVLNSIIGLYYYLTVLKVAYLFRSPDEAKPIHVPAPHAIALGLCVVAILVIGTLSAPWLDWSLRAAASLFG